MIQRFVITLVIAILSIPAMAQDRKVAVFDPAGSVDNAIKEIVREEISSVIVNAGGYAVLERQLINKVLEENRFQTGGLVDDSQISEMGKRMGANLVFVTSITVLGNANYYISCKMIDVQTARIEKQKTAQSSRSESDLIGVIQKTVQEMLGITTANAGIRQQTGRRISDERSIFAQERKVAIFDPAGSVDPSVREIVREEISSIIVNTDGYTVLERQLIDRVLEENRFQASGLVDDSQASEMGKRAGANLVFVTSMTLISSNYYLSFKLIDVETARIEKQQTAQTRRGSNDLIEIVQKIVGEMFGQTVIPAEIPRQTDRPIVATTPALPVEGTLTTYRKTIYRDFQKLSKNEVRGLMANTDALRMYNKGLSRNRNGNIWILSGLCVSAGGAFIYTSQPFERQYTYTGSDGNLYYGYEKTMLGVVIAGTGAVMMITGATLKVTSKSYVRKSVDLYNTGKNRSNVELKFGITGNGARVALHF